MNEIKYTNDGKKVSVVGKLNSTEWIVQEIFIQNDVEIPSGENFVVSSLHDSPSISWKEKEIKNIEKEYEQTKLNYKNKTKTLNNEYKHICNAVRSKIDYMRKLNDKFSVSSFSRLIDFLAGKIKYVLKYDYYGPELLGFNTAITNFEGSWDYKRPDGIKLISLYGYDDGTMEYKLHEYRDSSGNSHKVTFHKKYEDAIYELNNYYVSLDKYSETQIKRMEKYKIPIKNELLNNYYKKIIENKQKMVEARKKEIEKTQNEIEIIREKINE